MRLWSLYVPNGRRAGSPQDAYKLAFLDALRAHAAQEAEALSDGPLGLLRSFSVAPTDADVSDPAAPGCSHGRDVGRRWRRTGPDSASPGSGVARPRLDEPVGARVAHEWGVALETSIIARLRSRGFRMTIPVAGVSDESAHCSTVADPSGCDRPRTGGPRWRRSLSPSCLSPIWGRGRSSSRRSRPAPAPTHTVPSCTGGGVETEHVFHQQTPMGDLAVLIWEGLDPEQLGAHMADMMQKPASDHERYVRDHVVAKIHGVDLAHGAPPPAQRVATATP